MAAERGGEKKKVLRRRYMHKDVYCITSFPVQIPQVAEMKSARSLYEPDPTACYAPYVCSLLLISLPDL